MAESTQKKLSRVRPPRVQITYDVEIGDAIEKRELPFVVGIMSDLTGKSKVPMQKLRDRKFTEIDRDNINDVMSSLAPRAAFQVDNKLANDGTKLNVEVNFRNMEDFDPVNVIGQVKPLSELLKARRKLNDLLAKLDGNDELDGILSDVIGNTERQQEVRSAVASMAPAQEEEDESAGDDAPSEDNPEEPQA
tara:strand:- start:33 stop:608 length:576 start_codon:yes stop_codon:yes gene_type:complete